jgi:hypothetical protein
VVEANAGILGYLNRDVKAFRSGLASSPMPGGERTANSADEESKGNGRYLDGGFVVGSSWAPSAL